MSLLNDTGLRLCLGFMPWDVTCITRVRLKTDLETLLLIQTWQTK